MALPILDKKPSGKPHDWSYRKIHELKKAEPTVVRPKAWKNPNARMVAQRDQMDRGTCVGQSTAYCYDLKYISLTGDLPTASDIAQYKKNVIDSIGTLHDVLYPQSASAEAFYQVSRTIGNVTYPAGSETRFAARAWKDWGMCLETFWHTDKKGNMVWIGEPRKTTDGGLSMAEATTFAAFHRAEGWAMVGDQGGNATFDEICDAIYEKGFVLSGIPVYENYSTMQGGDGHFPEPKGNIAGYHALCMYGYDEDNIYLLHSWGDYCSTYGSVSREYINSNTQESVYLVVMDSQDVKIARGHYHSLTITVTDSKTKQPILADVYINGTLIGKAPQKVAVEPGTEYIIDAKMAGYTDKKYPLVGNDSDEEIILSLDPTENPQKSIWQLIIEWLKRIFRIP